MTEQRKTFIPDENETIIQMEIERLKTFKDHPFKVENDDEMKLLKESIEKYGILNPLIVRPLKEGVYVIIPYDSYHESQITIPVIRGNRTINTLFCSTCKVAAA